MNLVSSYDEIYKFCSNATKLSKYIAIDTEFVRRNTYYAKLCVIQLAFKEGQKKRVLMLDALDQNINLKPLIKLLRNNNIIKVIHASRQDLEIFLHLFNFLPTPLFDTQVAAMVCGKGEQESYENLVKNLLGKKINKSCQFTDWSKRPLSPDQIKYASEDVTFLCDIYEILHNELDNLGRSTWITEEITTLTTPKSYLNNDRYSFKKIKGVNGSINFKAIVLDLLNFRESLAQKLNLPRNHVIKDAMVLNIAQKNPKTLKELHDINIFQSKKELSSYYAEILQILNTPKNKIEPNTVPLSSNLTAIDDNTINTINLLKILLKIKSEELGVSPKLIATPRDLELIVNEEEPDVLALKGWRKEVFGKDALQLKKGKVALSVWKKGVRIVNVSQDNLVNRNNNE